MDETPTVVARGRHVECLCRSLFVWTRASQFQVIGAISGGLIN